MPLASPVSIKLKLRELAQLFNSMDPSPFHDRDLDADAEEFIMSWVREAPHAESILLTLHLETFPRRGAPPRSRTRSATISARAPR
jgi:hypothetical protein